MSMSLSEEYNRLKKEYEGYQKMAEDTMQKQSMKIMELDKKLDMLSLMVETSKYINKCLGSSSILSTINDIMIGILGVTYSSMYLMENRKLKLKLSNLNNILHHDSIYEFNSGKVGELKTCLLNSKDNLYKGRDSIEIHSVIFMPIYLKTELLGAIVVEHRIYNYLGREHIKLLTALSNQIAICIENNRLYNQIKENSERDFLTGLFNRNYFFSRISDKIKNCGCGFAITMIDIDNFKNCNDTFGHQFGDKVLRSVCDIIKNNLRHEDLVARYGGEEIIVYMYNIKSTRDVYNRMNFIKEKIKNQDIVYGDISSRITVSMGIGIFAKEENDIEKIIKRADINLYKAKNSGKDRIVWTE